jgi:phage-related protein
MFKDFIVKWSGNRLSISLVKNASRSCAPIWRYSVLHWLYGIVAELNRGSSVSVLNPVGREYTRWSEGLNDAKWTWRSIITGLRLSLSDWLARVLSGHAGWLSITSWAAQLTESESGTASDDREPGWWRKLAKGRGIGRINPRPAAFPPRGDAKYIRANGKSHNRTAQLRLGLRLTIKRRIHVPSSGYFGVHSKRICDFC